MDITNCSLNLSIIPKNINIPPQLYKYIICL